MGFVQFDEFIIIVVVLCVSFALIWLMTTGALEWPTSNRKSRIVGAAVLWVVGYAALNLVAIGFSANSKPHAPVSEKLTYQHVAEQMGLVSGETYPLILGARVGGSTADINVATTVTSGLFSARATTNLQVSSAPASAISLSYTYQEKTYILELPTSRVTFIQTESENPSVSVWLSGGSSYKLGEKVYAEYSVTDCDWKFKNLLFMCLWPPYDEPGPTAKITKSVTDVGLAPVIQASFDRATITLSPDAYKQLLGIIE